MLKQSQEAQKRRDLQSEERERLFMHGIHEETVFYNRLNVFLICESLLFAAAVSGLTGKEQPMRAIINPICMVGIVVTIVWWYAQVNKLVLLKTLEERLTGALPEFKESLRLANERRKLQGLKLWSASTILAHAFPILFILAWIYVLYLLRQYPADVPPIVHHGFPLFTINEYTL